MSFLGFTKEVIEAAVLWMNAAADRKERETDGPNDSPFVRECQHETGNKPPDSWCQSSVIRAFVVASKDKLCRGLKKSGACQEVRTQLKSAGRKVDMPKRGAMCFIIDMRPKKDGTPKDHAHHVCLCRSGVQGADEHFLTVEGNTNDGNSREGNGMYKHDTRRLKHSITHYEFYDLEVRP